MCLSVSGLWPVFTGDKPYITHTFARDLRTVRDNGRPACGSVAPVLNRDLFKVLDQLQYSPTNRNRYPI